MSTQQFPKLSETEMRQRLAPPSGPVRVVIDTDTANEIDDQFALVWALLSQDQLQIEGMYAEPYSFQMFSEGLTRAYELMEQPHQGAGVTAGKQEQAWIERYARWVQHLKVTGVHPRDLNFAGPEVGMEESYQEILRVYDLMGLDATGQVLRGADRYLTSWDDPVCSPAVEHLIERALAEPDEPLYVAAIGCVTNVASAILLEPAIIRNVVVLWTSGYPSHCPRPNTASFNLVQDLPSTRVLFDSGVPLVYLPGFHVGAQLRLSLPDMETYVRGRGAIGDYLYHLYTHNPIQINRGITDLWGRSWVIWDLINIAWLLNPAWVPSELTPAPTLGDDICWQRDRPDRHLMREAYAIDPDAIFRDFFRKLDKMTT